MLDWWALACALHRLASTISMMAVLLIGAYLVTYGELRIGDIVAFTGFAALLISRLDQISAFVNQVFDARARLEDFFRLEDSFVRSATSPMAPAISATSPVMCASTTSVSSSRIPAMA